jgi:membrane associated rhomboid family serine protease
MPQSLQVATPSWLPLHELFLLAAMVASLAVAQRLSSSDRRLTDLLRRRFVLGVPWGTLLTLVGVLSVYWFLQGGWDNPYRPLTVPFYSWSYYYPLGTITSPFAHRGMGHLTGNLRSALVFAPLVEYAIGHYPRERGSSSFSSLRTNPFARIFAVPVGSLVVGLLTGVFSLGPVIGFSGVVFAYAGFAFVTRPLLAVAALVGRRVVNLVYNGLENPVVTRSSEPGFFTPWWADIAIQGHALGIFLGVVAGLLVLRRRGEGPTASYLWFAALVFAARESLWAIYRPKGADQFVLYRAVGVGLIFLFAAAVATAVTGPDRKTFGDLEFSPRSVATLLIVTILVGVSIAAVPFGFTTVSGELRDDAERLEVRDYTVTYVENVPNQYATGTDVPFVADATDVRSSGVVVFSEERGVWLEAVPKGRLSFQGRSRVQVGGVGWRETVYAYREGWSLVGNGSTYRVTLRRPGERRRLAYTAEPKRAEPVIAGRNVSIGPVENGFGIQVTRGNVTLGRAPIPDEMNETRVGGLTLNRTGRDLYAIRNRTRVKVAKKSKPRAQQDR